MCYYFSATEAANLSTDIEKKEHRIKKSLRKQTDKLLMIS